MTTAREHCAGPLGELIAAHDDDKHALRELVGAQDHEVTDAPIEQEGPA